MPPSPHHSCFTHPRATKVIVKLVLANCALEGPAWGGGEGGRVRVLSLPWTLSWGKNAYPEYGGERGPASMCGAERGGREGWRGKGWHTLVKRPREKSAGKRMRRERPQLVLASAANTAPKQFHCQTANLEGSVK